MNKLVLDACVVAKTFINEPDSQEAINLIHTCVKSHTRVFAPDIFKYEIAQIAIKKSVALDKVLTLFEGAIFKLIHMQPPNHLTWLKAENICLKGHKKSGFPSIYDSSYHAMAILEDCLFITSDKRHYEKAKSFGHIALLKDWQKALDNV